ncbi:MAG TPA: hypothetical protein DHW63_10500 [Hyphomonadaceae bacterium]|nr:hypothetical protein [Hyphomonadaceae bacterium]
MRDELAGGEPIVWRAAFNADRARHARVSGWRLGQHEIVRRHPRARNACVRGCASRRFRVSLSGFLVRPGTSGQRQRGAETDDNKGVFHGRQVSVVLTERNAAVMA